ncbi:MAG TPA: methyltransferase domain-containing protein [Stellaceae bacterium]|jgi:SAM-dependent methyltransferase|nr:methyltransferase domain-containing protein [Stellaceae bacterium]
MVTEEDVRAAYRLFLDREAESPEVVARHVKMTGSLRELHERFLSSPEFRERNGLSQLMPLAAPPLDVELEATPAQLAAMVRHVEASWRRLGEVEPHFSVIVSDAYRAERIAETEGEFYETGKAVLEELRQTAERCGIDPGRYPRCFELGAGVGRVSVWLAGLFGSLVAADISAPHLALARKAAERFGRANIEFLHLASVADLTAAAEFDVFVSVIVLQHNPPPIIAMLLRAALSRLRPGGVAFFQVPIYRRGYRFRPREYLKSVPAEGGMEMHLIPQPALFRLLRESGCEILACHDDGSTGGYMVSNTIFARKRPEAAGEGDKPSRPSRWWWR